MAIQPEARTGPRPRRSAAADSERDSYSVPAVRKALAVLELMAGRGQALSMTEIAQALGRSMSEIYRVVLELERQGYLARGPSGEGYALSLKLFELAHQHPPTERIVRLSEPMLHELARATEQSCHLAVVEGMELLILATADSPRPINYALKIGARLPAIETSSGVVILAFRDRAAQVRLLDHLPAAERALYDVRFRQIRATGHERRSSAVVAGVTNLSAPIFDRLDRAVAALTIPFLFQLRLRASLEEAEARLIAAARTLSASLGWRAEPAPGLAVAAGG
jgi:DNA-binding IclR family transcriptional regulator